MSKFQMLMASLAFTVVAFGPAVATAKDTDVRKSGSCTAGSTSKIKLSPDDGRIETEFEVDQNRNGVTWKVVLKRNGKVQARTRAKTRAPSGSFEVRRRLGNGPGVDRIVARAKSPSGEVCRAVASI